MSDVAEFLVRAVLIGIGATVVLDLWSLFATRAFNTSAPNWTLVGRWIGHFPQGQFVQPHISEARSVRGENHAQRPGSDAAHGNGPASKGN